MSKDEVKDMDARVCFSFLVFVSNVCFRAYAYVYICLCLFFLLSSSF
jgi:hypothetical protein